MEKSWRDYVYLHSNVEGARAAFEVDCERLLKKMYPDKTVQVVRANPGDDGIDIYIGNIGIEPIEVYQCKFFLDAVGDSQKSQIRESFKTACESTNYSMTKWVLCMPSMDFDLQENLWWSAWKTKKENEFKIKIDLINGNRIKFLLKENDLYNITFSITDSLVLEEIRTTLQEMNKRVPDKGEIINRDKTNIGEILVNKEEFNILYTVRYTEEYEKYYVPRPIDMRFSSLLSYPKSVWIHGGSGIGKTFLCTRNLLLEEADFFYCYLSAVQNPKHANDLLMLLYENIYLKFEESLNNFIPSSSNWIKKVVEILLATSNNNDLIVYIDEVQIHDDNVFGDFANSIAAICAEFAARKKGSSKLKFLISTIKDPKQFYHNKQKANEVFSILEVPSWEEHELLLLANHINENVGVICPVACNSMLITKCKTPRILKEVIYQYKIQHQSQSVENVLNEVLLSL